jgi:CheY-like chemotaxis protein
VASILLVEDAPDLGVYEAGVLEQHGHTVLRCSGGPTPFAACPMIPDGSCPVADAADLIIFSCGMFGPLRHRTYRGIHLLRAYREHPVYGRLPMMVVSVGAPDDLGGTGPVQIVAKFASPNDIVDAVEQLLERSTAVLTR